MNYQLHYNNLIARARGRILEGYTERHHVVPRCMGGGNEKRNIVRLTPEEHFVAHQLLVKIFPRVVGLSAAAFRMSARKNTNKKYGWLRRAHAKAVAPLVSVAQKGRKHSKKERAKKSAAWYAKSDEEKAIRNAKASVSLTGKKRTSETKARMSEAAFNRPPVSARTRTKLSVAHKGQIPWNKGLSGVVMVAWNKGMKMTPDYCAKLSEAHKDFKPSKESNVKRSATLKGRAFTEERKANISRAKRQCSAETRSRIAAAARIGWIKRKTMVAESVVSTEGSGSPWNM